MAQQGHIKNLPVAFWEFLTLMSTVATPVCNWTNSDWGFHFFYMLTGSCFSDSGHYDYVPNLKCIYLRTTLNDPSKLYVCMSIYVCKINNYKRKILNLNGSAGAQLRTWNKEKGWVQTISIQYACKELSKPF